MEQGGFTSKLLRILAAVTLLFSFFPMAVMYDGIGMRKFVFWHFCVIYIIWGIFFVFGYICKRFAELNADKVKKSTKPYLIFGSRLAVIIPLAVFIAVSALKGLNPAVYIYICTASVAAFAGGYGTYGKNYSDIYSTGWFIFFIVSAIFAEVLLIVSNDKKLSETGNTLLCVSFGVLAVLSAVLANQTNIDVCTKQRASSNPVLPSGLRRYNIFLIIGICAVIIGLFVFAKPLAGVIRLVFSTVFGGISYLFNNVCTGSYDETSDDTTNSGESGGAAPPQEYNDWGAVIFVLTVVIAVVIIIAFRRRIMNVIKTALAPLFKNNNKQTDSPFFDEITTSDMKSMTPRARRKALRDMTRRYRKETRPDMKYRLGYALFLLKLDGTDMAPIPADTASVHREKGEKAFGADLGEFSEVYGKVRYGEIMPSDEELTDEETLLNKLK